MAKHVFFMNISPAVNKAYKTLENEEGYRRCKEIITEAKNITDEMVRKDNLCCFSTNSET